MVVDVQGQPVSHPQRHFGISLGHIVFQGPHAASNGLSKLCLQLAQVGLQLQLEGCSDGIVMTCQQEMSEEKVRNVTEQMSARFDLLRILYFQSAG